MPRPQGLRRTRQTEVIALGGGIDLQTPANARQPGTLLDCKNFVVPPTGGGYERFKGVESFGRVYQERVGGRSIVVPPIRSVFTLHGIPYAMVQNRSGDVESHRLADNNWEPTRVKYPDGPDYFVGVRGLVLNRDAEGGVPQELVDAANNDASPGFGFRVNGEYFDLGGLQPMSAARRWVAAGNLALVQWGFQWDASDGKWNLVRDGSDNIVRLWTNEQWNWMKNNPDELMPAMGRLRAIAVVEDDLIDGDFDELNVNVGGVSNWQGDLHNGMRYCLIPEPVQVEGSQGVRTSRINFGTRVPYGGPDSYAGIPWVNYDVSYARWLKNWSDPPGLGADSILRDWINGASLGEGFIAPNQDYPYEFDPNKPLAWRAPSPIDEELGTFLTSGEGEFELQFISFDYDHLVSRGVVDGRRDEPGVDYPPSLYDDNDYFQDSVFVNNSELFDKYLYHPLRNIHGDSKSRITYGGASYPYDMAAAWGQDAHRQDGAVIGFSADDVAKYAIDNPELTDRHDGYMFYYGKSVADDNGNKEVGLIMHGIVSTRLQQIVNLGGNTDNLEVRIGNFYGDLSRERAYIATGEGKAMEFDGTHYYPLDVFGREQEHLDKPTHIAIHGLHLWVSTPGGQLHYSQTGNPLKFGGATSGTIGVGDEITGLIGDYQGALIIFCRNKTFMLTGREQEDFELRMLSNNSGAIPKSVQLGESPVCMDDRGVRLVTPTDTFGDLALSTVSERIRPLIEQLRKVRITCSVIVREMNQYWVIYENGEILVMTWVNGPDGVNVQWSRLDFSIMLQDGAVITCAWSGEDQFGREVILLGASNGIVYRANSGNSLDGYPVNGYLVVVCGDMKQPNMNKRFYRLEAEVIAKGRCRFHHGVQKDYGGEYVGLGTKEMAGLFAQLDGFSESAVVVQATDPGFPRARWVSTGGIGMARNLEYVVTTGGDGEQVSDPFSITGLSLDWGPRRLVFKNY